MKRYSRWLTGIAAIALLAPLPGWAENPGQLSASIETGGAFSNAQDDVKKVDEYSTFRTKDGANPYGKAKLAVQENGIVLDSNFRFMDSRDQSHDVSLDVNRVLRTEFTYSALQHWLDHDQINYMNAAVPGPTSYTGSAANPLPLTPNNVPAYWYTPLAGTTTPAYGGSSATAPAGYSIQQIGRASVYGEDLTPNAVFAVKRTELVSKNDLSIPQLPNLTFHFNYRNEGRSGSQQSIGMSKCTSCHVTGQSKAIDENTQDITAGVTGKFGLLTIDYAFMNREFREQAVAPVRYYDPALSPGAALPANYNTAAQVFDNRMLYDFRSGLLRYDETPDSTKNSHIAKAKVDLPGSTSVMASYVKSKVDSNKTAETGSFTFNGANQVRLKTDYDAYGGKITSSFGKMLTVTLRGRAERLKNDDVGLQFDTLPLVPVASYGATPNQFTPTTASLNPTRYSVLSRDTFSGGLDAVYRLPLKTTLRFGYDYQLIDRHEEAFDKTTTHSFKAAINSRPTKTLTARAGITYKSIDDAFHNPHAALTNLTNNTGTTVGNGLTYGISLYDQRIADLSNQPEKVVDANIATTWTPSERYSITAMYRVKSEQNDLTVSKWKQDTHSPGVAIWYAPTQKVSMTLAYNYLSQASETAFCQGWYDG